MKEAGAEAGGAGFGQEGEGHEWELGIGSLIIDLDADIEKSGEGMADGLRMKIKRKNGGKVKHEVVMTSGKKKKTVGTMTEPELFGPCEPGTSVTLDGVVWQETDGGVLVVNVTWREKSYVGTLLDCTRHDWAPPRLCDDPHPHGHDSHDPKRKRSLKVRPKSAAAQRRTANSGFAVPPSPGKLPAAPVVAATGLLAQPVVAAVAAAAARPALIQCPEPNCNKKYKHINGLKYHQTHAHAPPAAATATATVPVPSRSPVQEQTAAAQAQVAAESPSPPSEVKAEPGETEQQQPAQPAAACPSSPAYSDISDANEESEEQGAESADEMTTDMTGSQEAAAQPVAALPVAATMTMTTTTTATTTPDSAPSFSSFAFCPNFRSRADESPDGLSFPYPYSYPAAFSLPASPATATVAGQQSECGQTDTGVCATMETTGPPPAPTHPTSSYFLHPLSFPHVPVFRMFPDKPPSPASASCPAPADPGPAPTDHPTDSGPADPPTQRHLHTHHHTHVGVPFPSYHPIAAFPLLSNPAPRAGTK